MAFTGQLGSAQLGSYVLGATGTSGTTFDVDADSTLSITQLADAVALVAVTRDGNSDLNITQTAIATAITPLFRSGTSTLSITQLGDAVAITPILKTADSTLTLTDLADAVNVTPILKNADSTLSITHQADASKNLHPDGSSSLTFTAAGDTLTDYARSVSNTLTIIQTAFVNVIRNLAASSTLVFSPSQIVPLPLFVQQVPGQPGQGYSYSRYEAIATVLKRKCHFILNVAGRAILLPCPEFGDTEATNGTVNIKQSMTGLTYAYARSGKTRKLHYTFRMGRQKSLELADFLTGNGAQVMQVTNHKAEVWYATCLTSPFEFEAQQRWLNDEERLEISLEFDGVKVMG